MCPLLLIALLHVHLAASCGPVIARAPIVNSSGAKALSGQRAREDVAASAPLATLPPDKSGLTPRPTTTVSLPDVTDLSLRFTFPPFDPEESLGSGGSGRHVYPIEREESFGSGNSVPRGHPPREPPRRFTIPPPSDPEDSFNAAGKSLPPDELPRDCADVQNTGDVTENGVYRIYRPSCLNPEKCGKDVNCDFQTDGGGWTIIQQRMDDSTSFFRTWKDYRNGFGDSHNFWIGNEYLYEVTTQLGQSYHLLVEVTDFDDRSKFSVYDKFAVSDEPSNYTLSLGKLLGDVDNFLANRNAPFGTYDFDTDENTRETCGAVWQSGWWHDPLCRPSGNLNVPYNPSSNLSAPTVGLRWRDNTGSVRVKSVQMKIRPKAFNPLLLINIRSRTTEDDKSSAEEPTLHLNFRSLSDSRRKLDRQSALWRRFRI